MHTKSAQLLFLIAIFLDVLGGSSSTARASSGRDFKRSPFVRWAQRLEGGYIRMALKFKSPSPTGLLVKVMPGIIGHYGFALANDQESGIGRSRATDWDGLIPCPSEGGNRSTLV